MSHYVPRHAQQPSAEAGPGPGRTAVAGLRALALTNPAGTADRIRHLLGTVEATMTADVAVDLRLLLAEALNRHQDHAGALDAAMTAMNVMTAHLPADGPRTEVGFGIVADTAVCLGLPEAPTACSRFREHVTAHGGNPYRLLVARALNAVAVYRDDPRHTMHHLQLLHHSCTDALFTAMLGRAITLTSQLDGTPRTGIRWLSALPGGLLSPDPTRPDLDYLAHRLFKISAVSAR